jgi:hypothetical protein
VIPQKIHDDIGTTVPFSERHKSTQAENIGADAECPSSRTPASFCHLSTPDCGALSKHTNPPSSVSHHLNGEMPDPPSTDAQVSGTARSDQHSTTTSQQSHPEPLSRARGQQRDNDDGEFSGYGADFDEHAFDHPSTYQEQQYIWIPKDTLGLSAILVNDLKAVGVEANDSGASMDECGNVEVLGNPRDECSDGGVGQR